MREASVLSSLITVISLIACREATSAKTSGASLPLGEVRVEAAFGTDGVNALRYPVWFGEIPGRAGTFLAVERGGGEDGRAYVFERKDGEWSRRVFLTLSVGSSAAASDERGFLGLAFHPRFAENRRYFVFYMPPRKAGSGDSTVVEERRADSSLQRDAGGRPRRVLSVAQPYANHNGGTLAFGPRDGFLYIGLGDGGAAGDPHGAGQDLGNLLGKMLRIDVDDTVGGKPYGIPLDNPFASGKAPNGGVARPEVWAYGLRNPWKWSFDPETGDLWAGDVGQNAREEVSVIRKGENHGWRRMEGFACFDPPTGCRKDGLTLPMADLPRDAARSITGGYVYRGEAAAWQGAYLFGDWETRNWWALPKGHKQGDPPLLLGRLPDQPSSFGTDAKGNLYVVGYKTGRIYKVVFPTK